MVDSIMGGRVLTADRRLVPRDLHLADGRIDAISAPSDRPAGGITTDVLNANGYLVVPGFIDTHVHGGRGHNFMDLGDGGAVARHLASTGVTACVATTSSTDPATLLAAVADLAGRRDLAGTVELLGIHLEGPYLAASHRGVHRAEHLRPPDRAELDELLAAAEGRLRIVTLAPELPGADDAIDRLCAAGVTVSLGHSGCTYDAAVAAFDRGMSRVTHCFNALPSIHHRAPGPIVAALARDDVYLEVIGDGRHVVPAVIGWLAGQAGDRLVLVSDGVDVAGLPHGPHRRWEGTDVVLGDDGCRTIDGGLAGGATGLAACVRNLVHSGALSLVAALVAASEAPAQALDVHDRKGRIAVGYDADLVLLDENTLDLHATIRGGDITHAR